VCACVRGGVHKKSQSAKKKRIMCVCEYEHEYVLGHWLCSDVWNAKKGEGINQSNRVLGTDGRRIGHGTCTHSFKCQYQKAEQHNALATSHTSNYKGSGINATVVVSDRWGTMVGAHAYVSPKWGG
jgi:hypothetical protein